MIGFHIDPGIVFRSIPDHHPTTIFFFGSNVASKGIGIVSTKDKYFFITSYDKIYYSARFGNIECRWRLWVGQLKYLELSAVFEIEFLTIITKLANA